MGFIERLTNILKSPKKAMEDISKTPLVEEAVMVVGIYGVMSAVAGYIQSTKIRIIMEGVSPGSPEFAGTIGIIASIIITFISWFILTGIIHMFSLVLGGKGKFYPHMMVIVGFAMIPLIFSTVIGAVILSTIETFTVTISMKNPEAAQQVLRNIQGSTPFLVQGIINILAWVWSLGIIHLGIQVHQKLSKGKALIIVLIPLVLILLMTYGSFIMG